MIELTPHRGGREDDKDRLLVPPGEVTAVEESHGDAVVHLRNGKSFVVEESADDIVKARADLLKAMSLP